LIGGAHRSTFGVPAQDGATYSDIGVGGLVTFDVTEPLNIHVAPYPGDPQKIDNPDHFDNYYSHAFNNMVTAVGEAPPPSNDPIDEIIFGLQDFNVFGMPLFKDKVVVMDATDLNQFAIGGVSFDNINNTMLNTSVHDASTADTNPAVPASEYHIQTTYADFSRFTQTEGATNGPNTA